jgi:hypothetical protein
MPRHDPVDRSAVTAVYREHLRRSRLLVTRRAARLVTLLAVLAYAAYRLGGPDSAARPGLLVAILALLGISAWVVAIVFDLRVRDDRLQSRILSVRIESLHRLIDTVRGTAGPERDESAS